MVYVNSTKATAMFGLDRVVVFFKTADTKEDLNDYTFNLYRSESGIDSDYHLVLSNVPFEVEDFSVNLYDENIKYFYKIQVVDKDGNKTMSDETATMFIQNPDKWGTAIADITKMYLHNVVKNDTMYLLKKKRFGTICSCWDDIRRIQLPDCPHCYGTKYAGGYFNPIPIEVNYSGPSTYNQLFEPFNIEGEQESGKQLWTSNYPVIQAEDILVDKWNNRYIVTSVTPTMKDFFLIRQIVTIQKKAKTNIVYDVPLDIERSDFYR